MNIFFDALRMKERIKQIMESQHMTQQTFAQFIQISPASLSSIFNDRTKPTLAIVEAICAKIPTLSLEWLMFGTGAMYKNDVVNSSGNGSNASQKTSDGMLNFAEEPSPTSPSSSSQSVVPDGDKTTMKPQKEVVKIIDKKERKISEIRIFYDDNTWETFVPAKS